MTPSLVRRPTRKPPTPAASADDSPPAGSTAGNWRAWLDVRGDVHGDEAIQARFGMPLIDPVSPGGENYHEPALFIPDVTPHQQRAITRQATLMQGRNLTLKDWRDEGGPEDGAALKELQDAVAEGQRILVKILSNEPRTPAEARHPVAAPLGPRNLDPRDVVLQIILRAVVSVGAIWSTATLSQYHHDIGSPVCDPIVFTVAMIAVAAALLLYLVNRPLPLH